MDPESLITLLQVLLASVLAVTANPTFLENSPKTGISSLIKRGQNFSLPIVKQGSYYTTKICIGQQCPNDNSTYNLMVSTGTGNTWIGANPSHLNNFLTSYHPTDQNVIINYSFDKIFTGAEYIIPLYLTPDLAVPGQSIGVSTGNVTASDTVDGIFGLGQDGLTFGSLSPNTGVMVPTVTHNLYWKGIIPANVFAISFKPPAVTTNDPWTGAITWGGVDNSNYSTTHTNIATDPSFNGSWAISARSIYLKSTPLLSRSTSGTVDTSYGLLYLASDAYDKYVTATGAKFDDKTKRLTIDPENLKNGSMQSLFFDFAGDSFELNVDAQVSAVYNTAVIEGSDPDKIYLNIASLPTDSSHGPGFILGLPFQERYDTVYDTAKQTIGFSVTTHSLATINTFGIGYFVPSYNGST